MERAKGLRKKLEGFGEDLNDAQIRQRNGVHEKMPEFKSTKDASLAENIDQYYRDLDKVNSRCRWFAKACSIVLCISLLMFTIIYLVIIKAGYQKFDPVVGNVQVRVRGVTKQSPDPSVKDAAIYDAADLVGPSKERNAVFIATSIFNAQPQLRFDAGNKEHNKCADIKPCSCPLNQPCAECGSEGDYGANGMYTGMCLDIAPPGGVQPPNRRCEVKAWCPVAEINRIQRRDYQPDQENNGLIVLAGLENLGIDINVNARSELFDRSMQHQFTLSLGTLLKEANIKFGDTKESGAIIYAQAVFSCNLDLGNDCKPKISYIRMDEKQVIGSPMKPGYNFKHVRYSTVLGDNPVEYRHVQHLTGYRIVFDLNGHLRQFDFGMLIMTLSMGLAITAVGFLVIDQARQNLERVYLKTRTERAQQPERQPLMQTYTYSSDEDSDDEVVRDPFKNT